jgi:hypothetical protein
MAKHVVHLGGGVLDRVLCQQKFAFSRGGSRVKTDNLGAI